jgi:hypothetical protein
MPKVKENSISANSAAVTVGYKAELRRMASLLRGSREVADYKYVGLGLIFLKPA